MPCFHWELPMKAADGRGSSTRGHRDPQRLTCGPHVPMAFIPTKPGHGSEAQQSLPANWGRK